MVLASCVLYVYEYCCMGMLLGVKPTYVKPVDLDPAVGVVLFCLRGINREHSK
jgi:hypothetical protein